MIEAALACASECGARAWLPARAPSFPCHGPKFRPSPGRSIDACDAHEPPIRYDRSENIDAALALAVNNRPEMHLADDVLPEDVVRAVAVEVTGTHELPGRYDWGEDVDASALALAVQHRPIVHLAVAVLPEHVSGSDPGVVDGRSKGGIAEAGSGVGPARCSASGAGVDADRNVAALNDDRTAGIGDLGIGVIPKRPRRSGHQCSG